MGLSGFYYPFQKERAMNATTHGVYLVTDEDEIYLGSVKDISKPYYHPYIGPSMVSVIMDIIAEIMADPIESSKTVTIKIHE